MGGDAAGGGEAGTGRASSAGDASRRDGRADAPLVRSFGDADTAAVVALWRAAGLTRPWNDPHRDIERRRALEDGLFLVAEDADGVVGSAMGGYDGHRGWVYYVAVDPDRRRRGIARALMAELERRLLARGCPKINLQVRTGNDEALAFYARLGFDVDATVGLGKRLIPDD